MKKLFLLLAVFTFVGISNAQEKSKSKELSADKIERKNNFDEWSKELNLTEAQKAEINKINDEFSNKKAAIRQTGTAADFKKLNDEKKAAVEAILTPEQKVKQQELKEKKTAEKEKKAEMRSQKK